MIANGVIDLPPDDDDDDDTLWCVIDIVDHLFCLFQIFVCVHSIFPMNVYTKVIIKFPNERKTIVSMIVYLSIPILFNID